LINTSPKRNPGVLQANDQIRSGSGSAINTAKKRDVPQSGKVGTKVFIPTQQHINGWDDLPKQTSAVVPKA
jgi:hypothetical protein